MKTDILSRARRAKMDGFYANEHLTPLQHTISYVLRKAKREFPAIVSGTTTYDGKNFVWVKPARPGARDSKVHVANRKKLEEFCSRALSKPLSHFIKEWKH